MLLDVCNAYPELNMREFPGDSMHVFVFRDMLAAMHMSITGQCALTFDCLWIGVRMFRVHVQAHASAGRGHRRKSCSDM